ncbi:MAG: alpha/beta hydrolase [Caulobacteraceae bacterium]|nr:alpha/beta hydrolase [Caulobacteraceae bacterium]
MGLAASVLAALLALAAPSGSRVTHDLAYGPGERGRLDVYRPRRQAAAPEPLVVFLYGGGWQSGDKAFYRFIGATLASRGLVVAIPDYRVFPQVRYPDFLRDNALAVRFARDHAAEWGADPGRLFLVGHSAGAYDVAMLALDRRWLGQAGLDPRRDIAGAVGLAGPYDFLPLRDEKLKIIFGPEQTRADTQPINHVDGRAPPMLLLAGDKDRVVDPGNATRLAAAIATRGGEVEARILPDLGHVGVLTAILGPFRHRGPVLRSILDFIARRPAVDAARLAA